MHAHIRTRGRLFAASFRRWQAFGSGPHVGLMLTHSPDPHRPEGLSHGLRCRRHSHTQLGDVSCMEYIVTPHILPKED